MQLVYNLPIHQCYLKLLMGSNAAAEGAPSRPTRGDCREPWLYHERQQDALCGVHALNALVQGPLFSEVDLSEVIYALCVSLSLATMKHEAHTPAPSLTPMTCPPALSHSSQTKPQIAQHIDTEERALLAEGGVENRNFLTFATEESANVSLSGMFSIQVLSAALDIYGISVIPLASLEGSGARISPQDEWGFLCNLEEHWLAVRKVNDSSWWNFNSLFPAPRPLTSFYLSAFLDSLQTEGYTIFVVRGNPPPSEPGNGACWLLESQARLQASQALDHHFKPDRRQMREFSIDGDDELQRAMAASLADVDDFADDEGANMAAAIAASLRSNPQSPSEGEKTELNPMVNLYELGEEPEAGDGVAAELAIKSPAGGRWSRRFRAGDKVGHVVAFAVACGIDMSRHQLCTSFPRRRLEDWRATLREVGLLGKHLLYVEPL